MRYSFHAEQWLPYPLELVFAFFSNPENLPRLMPRWQQAHIEEAAITPPPPRPGSAPRYPGVVAGPGTRLALSFRAMPYLPFRVMWEAKITDFVWNDHFCDRQMRGPFRSWNHCHKFSARERVDRDGFAVDGTIVEDGVDYEVPLGLLGEMAHELLIRRQLISTFAYRKKRTAELLPRMATAVAKFAPEIRRA
jgi:ligand-binding SRPBCC domain-containing protein